MGWSAQSLLLGYLEQTPLYNAANFSFDPVDGMGGSVNATVVNTKINSFLCPADSNVGKALPDFLVINSYYASQGTSVQNTPTSVTGLFCFNNCYGIQSVTDGTSQTIAFSEGIGGNDKYSSYAGNGVVNCIANGCTAYNQVPNEDANGPGIAAQLLNNIQVCTFVFRTNARNNVNISGNRGEIWAWGGRDQHV